VKLRAASAAELPRLAAWNRALIDDGARRGASVRRLFVARPLRHRGVARAAVRRLLDEELPRGAPASRSRCWSTMRRAWRSGAHWASVPMREPW
jgi:GNAT superfamily N-acetyltransferase